MLKMKECLTKKVIPLLVATSMAGGMITQTATITLAAENEAMETDATTYAAQKKYIGKIVDGVSGITVSGNKVQAVFDSGKALRVTFLSEPADTIRIQMENSVDNDFDEKPALFRPKDYPLTYPEADMLIKQISDFDNGPTATVTEEGTNYVISGGNVKLYIDKEDSKMKLVANGKTLWEEEEPLYSVYTTKVDRGKTYEFERTVQTLKTDDSEYFYGGGQQNGRFSHKGKKLAIRADNSWDSGASSSPVPLYISTKNYGVFRHTWAEGRYDFGADFSTTVSNYHDELNELRFDEFCFAGNDIADVLNKFYDLTGKPALLPEFAFYQGHANAYNRDYWQPYENSKYPKITDVEVQPSDFKVKGKDENGNDIWIQTEPQPGWTRESLNGPDDGNKESYEYKISARKILDNYIDNDMPFGWILPNDGYGSGYGQEDTHAGNIENLHRFAKYLKQNGAETGLWTQQDIWPEDEANPKPDERDIKKEVGAGVRALKTDVAWVSPGYSFEVNGVKVAADALKEYGDKARPFIISVAGWAGTQRHASLWSGDQYGGNWEYIRFHIPTYIGTGLSGNPNVGSDMDGIFGGDVPYIHTRDFQWKTFSPIEINMDGWSGLETIKDDTKNPPEIPIRTQKNSYKNDEPYKSIVRMYLKLKAQMLPYTYSTAAASSSVVPGMEDNGKPIIRAMVVEYPNDPYTYGTETQYQYMYGKNLLVAPIYEGEGTNGPDLGVRNNIYLPDENQVWIDYFTGQQYKGNSIINDFDAPLWKIPLFVKDGAIIPMTVENNSPVREGVTNENVKNLTGDEPRIFDVYPSGNTEFTLYEDDGTTLNYLEKADYATTKITSTVDKEIADIGDTATAVITVEPAQGNYSTINKNAIRGTEFNVNVQQKPTGVKVTVGGNEVSLTEAASQEEFDAATGNVYFYNEAPSFKTYSTATEDTLPTITTSPKVFVKVEPTDVTQNQVQLTVEGFNNYNPSLLNDSATDKPSIPTDLKISGTTPTSISLAWEKAGEQPCIYELEITKGTLSDNPEDNAKIAKAIIRNIKENTFEYKDAYVSTDYNFRIRAVNSKGVSEWTDYLKTKTSEDPYRDVPKGITINRIVDKDGKEIPDQGGGEIRDALIDGNNETMYHSGYSHAIQFPAEIVLDMGLVYPVEKFEYIARSNVGNGTFQNVDISYGLDGKHWIDVEKGTDLNLNKDNQIKVFNFENLLSARYIKMIVNKSTGGFLSGNQLRPYVNGYADTKGAVGKPEGDSIASPGTIDAQDLVEYKRYGSLRNGEVNWGQLKLLDINLNNVIDAYDLAYMTSQYFGDKITQYDDYVDGQITLVPDKTDIKAGEEVTIKVMGNSLRNVYGFNLDIPLDKDKYDINENSIGITVSTAAPNTVDVTRKMLTKEHSTDAAIPEGGTNERVSLLMANQGNQSSISGESVELATVKLKAKVDTTFDIEPTFGLLTDNNFHEKDALTEPTGPPTPPEPDEPEIDKIKISDIEAKDKDNQIVRDQPGSEIIKAIDGLDSSSADGDIWHTYWGVNPDYEPIQFPVNIVLTMDKLYSLNKFEYLPRESGTNGTITNATLSYSADGNTWTESGSVTWAGTGTTETANFTTPISAKYFKITIPEGGSKGGFISAREFKLYGKETTTPTDPEQALKDAVNDAKSILDETQTPNPTINQMLEGIKNLSDAIKNYNSPQN